jgi:hypothetical protein
VLEEASLNTAFADVSRSAASTSSSADTTPILLRVTNQIRAVVTQTLKHLGLPAPTLVDVTIDDIR